MTLDGLVMYPVDFDSTKKYPVLFHVYGEPAEQTATDIWWSKDPWHLMLTQMGYAVITIDNRGTPSLRGRAWRKSIYRKIGVSCHGIRPARRVRSGAGAGWIRLDSASGGGAAADR